MLGFKSIHVGKRGPWFQYDKTAWSQKFCRDQCLTIIVAVSMRNFEVSIVTIGGLPILTGNYHFVTTSGHSACGRYGTCNTAFGFLFGCVRSLRHRWMLMAFHFIQVFLSFYSVEKSLERRFATCLLKQHEAHTSRTNYTYWRHLWNTI